MNLAGLDLNLLVALDALLAESSVARAALRLGRSQPAVSHALRNLRHRFDDPLLVRCGHKMLLTPRAESLKAPVREVIEKATALLGPNAFDPVTCDRRFRLMMPDLAVSILLPALVARISNEAPNIVLELVGWRGPETMTADFARSLDIVVSWSEHNFSGFHRYPLYRDRDALAFRTGHPAAGRLSSIDGFLSVKHIAVVGGGEQSDPIDQWLAEHDLQRPIGLIVATYVQALHVAANTDLVAFAPGRTITALAPRLDLDRCDPPIDPGEDQQMIFCPARSVRDPGTVWLRMVIQQTCQLLPVHPARAGSASSS